jgi:hypothetical protein
MVTAQIPWGDGTSDMLVVTFSGNVGVEEIVVSSAPNNTTGTRTKKLTFKSQGGTMLAELTVTQGVATLCDSGGILILTNSGDKIIVNA